MGLLMKHMSFIKKWVSIENIVCQPGKSTMDIRKQDGARSFLEPSVEDYCEKFILNDCGKEGGEFRRISKKKKNDLTLWEGQSDGGEKERLFDTLQATEELLREIEQCGIYISSSKEGKKKCVNKTRIKYFEGGELAQKITGRGNDEFKILDTVPYGGHGNKGNNFGQFGKQTIFCNILSNARTESVSDLYILFSCGAIFDSSELWPEDNQTTDGAGNATSKGTENIKIKNEFIKYLDMLFNKLKENGLYDNPDSKLILCGHSMGCVLACRFAYFIKQKYNDFFNKQCIVIGSAPFRWLPEEKAKNFNNLENVFIFIASESFGKKGLSTDPSLHSKHEGKVNENFTTYLPMFNLINNIKKKRIELTEIDEIPTADLETSKLGEFIHMWGNYFKLFSSFRNTEKYESAFPPSSDEDSDSEKDTDSHTIVPTDISHDHIEETKKTEQDLGGGRKKRKFKKKKIKTKHKAKPKTKRNSKRNSKRKTRKHKISK